MISISEIYVTESKMQWIPRNSAEERPLEHHIRYQTMPMELITHLWLQL